MAKHSQPFFEITTRLYLPLDGDLQAISKIHGIDFSQLLKRAEVVNLYQHKQPEGKAHGKQ